MKSIIKSFAFIGLMCVGTTSWAIPFTTGFTLYGSSGGELCLLGCTGSLTAESTTSTITDIDITIATGSATLPELHFGTPVMPGLSLGTVSIVDDAIKSITTSISSGTGGHLLVIGGDEWAILADLFSGGPTGEFIPGGGSRVTIPEPGIAALLGLGLVALGFSRKRRTIKA